MSSASMKCVLTTDEIDNAVERLLGKLEDHATFGSKEGETTRLERHIVTLQATLRAVRCRLDGRIAQTRQQRNGLVFFHRLPTELVVKIFHLALTGRISQYLCNLTNVSAVSSAWRAIVLESPALWAFIHNSNPRLLVKMAFERSKNHPLEVVSLSSNATGLEIARHLIQERSRIRSLNLDLCTGDALDFADGPAPALETIDLSSWSDGFDTKEGVDLFKGHAPRLRDISLTGISILWDSPILVGLKSLQLGSITRGGPSVTRLLQILTQTPELSRLSLTQVKLSKGDTFDMDTHLPIFLPILRSLRLVGVEGSDTLQLVDSIRVPACQELVLDSKAPFDPPVSSILHLGLPIRTALASHKYIKINITEKRFEFHTGSVQVGAKATGDFFVALPIKNAKQHLEWLAGLLSQPSDGNTPNVEVTIGASYIINDPTIINTIDQMQITRLELDTQSNTNPIIQHLGDSTPTNSGRRWRFSNLQHLRIHGHCGTALLLEMLEVRYSQPAMQNGEQSRSEADLPVPLKSLTFVGQNTIDVMTIQRVGELIGPGIAEWEGVDLYNQPDFDPVGMGMWSS